MMKFKQILVASAVFIGLCLSGCAANGDSSTEGSAASQATSSSTHSAASSGNSAATTSAGKTSNTSTSKGGTSSSGHSSSVPATSEPTDRAFSKVTTFTSPVKIHTADQQAFVDFKGGYENLSESQIQNTYHVNGNTSLSEPVPVSLSWEQTPKSTLKNYAVEFAKDSAFKDVVSFAGTKDKKLDIYNLCIGQDYYYRVKAIYSSGDPDVSDAYQLSTVDSAPRNVKIDGMTNCRDIGGRTTAAGARLRQGLLYRTAAADDSQSGSIITDAGKKTMLDVLKVKTEIELRGGSNGDGGEASSTSASKVGSTIKFNYIPFAYSNGKNLLFRNIEPVRKVFDVLGDEANYPIFYHCRIGTDRTGLISLLLNGLLGVSLQEMYQDYLFSDFGKIGKTSTIGQVNNDSIAGYCSYLQAFQGDTLQMKVYNFLLTLGVPAAKLDTIIRVMTDGNIPASDADKIVVTPVSGLVPTGMKVDSQSATRSPAQSVKFNAAGQKVSYFFANDKAFEARLFANVMSRNTSSSLDAAFKVTLDGSAVSVKTSSFATSDLGFGSNADYWIPAEFGNVAAAVAVAPSYHTLIIESKSSVEVSLSQIALLLSSESTLTNLYTNVDPNNCAHLFVNTTVRAGSDTETAATTDECQTCGQRTITFKSHGFIAGESNDVDTANADYVRFSKAENVGGVEGKGTHLVYEIYCAVPLGESTLALNASFNATASYWAAASGDTTVGYVKDSTGALVASPYRYGLLINGVEAPLSEETHEKPANTNTVWATMPASFTLKEGLNKIELVSLGGYRAKIYDLKIVGKHHEHTFTTVTVGSGSGSYTISTCTCGATDGVMHKKWSDNLEGVAEGEKIAYPTSNTAGDGGKVTFKIDLAKAVNVVFSVGANSSHNDFALYPGDDASSADKTGDNQKLEDVEEWQKVCRYGLSVNGKNVEITNHKTYSDNGLSSSGYAQLSLATINLEAGTNTIVLSKPNLLGYRVLFGGEVLFTPVVG